MLGTFIWTLFILVVYISSMCCPSLHSKFSHYEILTGRHISIRVKRYSDGRKTPHKELTLSVFGRKVSLSIKPGLPPSLLSPDANLHAIHANGTKSRIDLDPDDFHQGVIKGHPGSRVNSFYHEGLWTIQAVHPVFSFSVEPLSYHTGFESNQQMLAYRHQDVRFWNDTGQPLCQSAFHSGDNSSTSGKPTWEYKFVNTVHSADSTTTTTTSRKSAQQKQEHRKQRNASKQPKEPKKGEKTNDDTVEVCDVLAVADYRFFNGIADRSVYTATKLMIFTYKIANDIFLGTAFLPTKTVGLQIRTVEVYTSAKASSPVPFLNDDLFEISASLIVREMAFIPYVKEYCLMHLHTQRNFKNNVVGIAVTPKVGERLSEFGICQLGNVGLSSTQTGGTLMPLSIYTLVVAHEISHNFGARHDDENGMPRECTPSVDGNYLMWPKVSTARYPNNFKLSPCSIQSIAYLLRERNNCLVPKDALDHSVCGNGVVDYGEDCDAGFVAIDPCCTPRCRFTRRATCSPFNHPCCQNCTAAPKTLRCTFKAEVSCAAESFCDGVHSHSCPLSKTSPNGQKCKNHGECWRGFCIGYCQLLGKRRSPAEHLEHCSCVEDRKNMCSICCKKTDDVKNGCKNSGKYYDDGEICHLGFCEKGVCHDASDMDELAWNGSIHNTGDDDDGAGGNGIRVRVRNVFIVVYIVVYVCALVMIMLYVLYNVWKINNNNNSRPDPVWGT